MTGRGTGPAEGTAATRRGGVPVGRLSELPQIEAGAVVCLRLWCDGAAAQARLWIDLSGALGAGPARDALNAFERLIDELVHCGRRPLMRHHRECACVGADEAAFATMIAAAAEGQREDAVLLAALLVPPMLAPDMAEQAGAFGRALRRMSVAFVPTVGLARHPDILH